MAFQDSNPFGVLADTQSPSPAAAGSPPQVQLVGAEGEEPLEVVIEVNQKKLYPGTATCRLLTEHHLR